MSLENLLKTPKKIKRLANQTIKVALTAAMLSLPGCGDNGDGGSDSVVNPPEPPSQPSDTLSVPIPIESQFIDASTGGTLYSNGYEVIIPAGALSQDATVQIGSPSSSIREITRDNAQRISSPLEIKINTTLLDDIEIRFPISQSNEGYVGMAYGDGRYDIEELVLDRGKLEMKHLPSASLYRTENETALLTTVAWIIYLPYALQSVQLNQRGVNLNSSEKVALLVHGFGSTPATFDGALLPLLNEIYNNRVMTFQYPSGLSISTNITNIETKINALGSIPFKFDVVAHSMGGLVTRGFARRNPNKIDKLITLGTPHFGLISSLLLDAYVTQVINFGLLDEKIFNPYAQGPKDAITGSDFLRDLNATDTVNSHYHLISGNHPGLVSVAIPEENDGLVAITSAELGSLSSRLGGSSLYPNAETVLSFERHRIFTTHKDLRVNSTVMEVIRNILEQEEEQVLVLQPGSEGIDTFILNSLPGINYGSYDTIFAQSYTWAESAEGDIERGLIKFDLSAAPDASRITSATLSLYGYSRHLYDPGLYAATVSLKDVLSNWSESTVTWNNQPSYGSEITRKAIGSLDWYSFDITTLVKDWKRGARSNYGVEINIFNEEAVSFETPQAAFFHSSDRSSNRPKLEIHYTP